MIFYWYGHYTLFAIFDLEIYVTLVVQTLLLFLKFYKYLGKVAKCWLFPFVKEIFTPVSVIFPAHYHTSRLLNSYAFSCLLMKTCVTCIFDLSSSFQFATVNFLIVMGRVWIFRVLYRAGSGMDFPGIEWTGIAVFLCGRWWVSGIFGTRPITK